MDLYREVRWVGETQPEICYKEDPTPTDSCKTRCALVTDHQTERWRDKNPIEEAQSTIYKSGPYGNYVMGWVFSFNSFDEVAAIAKKYGCGFTVRHSSHPTIPMEIMFSK